MADDKNPARTAFETHRANDPDALSLEWENLDDVTTRAWDAVADAVRAPLLARIDDLEAEIQGYRGLCADIESTMVEPDRWDGDDAESAILGRYVKWLAGCVASLEADSRELRALRAGGGQASGRWAVAALEDWEG